MRKLSINTNEHVPLVSSCHEYESNKCAMTVNPLDLDPLSALHARKPSFALWRTSEPMDNAPPALILICASVSFKRMNYHTLLLQN